MKKKLFVVIAAIVILCTALTACTDNPAPTAGPTATAGPAYNPDDYTFDLPDASEYDFGGRTFVVYSYHGQPFEQRTDFIRRYAQNDQIEKLYNCKVTYDRDLARGQNDALTGNPTIDFAYLMNHQLAAWVIGGIAEPLNAYADDVKITDARWDTEVTELATINGKTYAVAKQVEELWKYHYTLAMFMNKDLLINSGLNPEEIYTLQANKQWTWDAFQEKAQALTKDYNHDDVPDVYGTTLGSMQVFTALCGSIGTTVYKKTDSGYTFDYDDKVLQVMDFMHNLYVSDAARGTQAITGISSSVDAQDFLAGSIGFNIATFSTTWISYQSSMTDEYGVLCIPIAPGETDYHIVDNMYASNVMFAQVDKAQAKTIAQFMYIYNTSLYESAEDEEEMFWIEAENRITDEGSRYYLEKVLDRKNYVTLVNDASFSYNGAQFLFEEVIAGSKSASEYAQEVAPTLKVAVESLFSTVQ